MADTKFTPGPWVAISRGSYGPDGEEADVHVQEWWDINGPLDDTNFMRGSYSMADAHLIATAPELYEALQDVLGLIPLELEESPMVAFAKATLAKARGEAA